MRHVAMVDAGMAPVRGGAPVHRRGDATAERPPSGAAGVTQCVELFAPLRGDATDQVDGARVTLAHNVGGPTAVAAVTILEGPGEHGR